MARRWWLNLTDPSTGDRVFAFVVAQTDWRNPLPGSHQLLDDLGVDGDEAVDFFEAFEAEFQVELEPLHLNWARHFGPEGFPFWLGLLMVVIGGAVAIPLALFTSLPKWAVIGLSMAAGFGWLIGLRAWPLPRPRLTPITVDQLVQAAETGRWPEPPPS